MNAAMMNAAGPAQRQRQPRAGPVVPAACRRGVPGDRGSLGDGGVLAGVQRVAPGADGLGPGGGQGRGPADAPLGPPGGCPGGQAADHDPGDRPGGADQAAQDRGEHGPGGSGDDGGQVRPEGLRPGLRIGFWLGGIAGHTVQAGHGASAGRAVREVTGYRLNWSQGA